MKVAGLAWIVSNHGLNNQSAGKTGNRLAGSRSGVFSSGISETPVWEGHKLPKQKSSSRRWKILLLRLKALSASSANFIKKISSVSGQRDIDQLHVKQFRQEQEPGSGEENADALAREKIKSYEYTGH